MKDKRKDIGALGERCALAYLRKLGMRLVAANWRCRAGEIDLVLKDGEELVFVEVKTRLSAAIAERYIFANVTWAKQKKLRLLVSWYLRACWKKGPYPRVRGDVVGVILDRQNLKVRFLKHLQGAF